MIGLLLSLAVAASTMDSTAIAALNEATECSKNRVECGGYIYMTGKGYAYTKPIPGHKYSLDLSKVYAAQTYIVADYHIHVCDRGNYIFSRFFSPADVIANTGLHIIGYMYSYCDGYVKRFDPQSDPPDDIEVDFKSGNKLYLATGHIVGILYVPRNSVPRVYRTSSYPSLPTVRE